jgi:tRNA uridine 5-carboxymethylaminomethyl modification enzyme
MFTSRAEHRLLFNHGSAELRLVEHSESFKLLTNSRLSRIKAKAIAVDQWIERLTKERAPDHGTWAEQIRRQATTERGEGGENPLSRLSGPDDLTRESTAIREEVLYRVAYAGYLEREYRQIEKQKHLEQVRIPQGFDFLGLRGLRKEGAAKLASARPFSLAQASRISGVTPADISVLMVAIGRGDRR